MRFTEYDGMILTGSPEYAAQNCSRLKKQGQWRSRWQYERGANHSNARMTAPDREQVRQELAIFREFEASLRSAYPDHPFVITHTPCTGVSFYQAIDGAPTEGSRPIDEMRPEGKAWCQTCQCNQYYTPLPSPDPEFPAAEWGRCTICGTDVITHYSEILTLLPAQN